MERTLRSAILTARNVFKDKAIVPGAGAFEAAIAVRMANLADLTPGLLQHALKAYAASFYAIPRQLACNAGQVASSSVDRIESAHLKALTVDSTVSSDSFCSVGINIESTSSDANALTANSGVLELFAVKKSAIELASDAVITLLRVDQIIMAKQANGPKARPAGPQDDDDMA